MSTAHSDGRVGDFQPGIVIITDLLMGRTYRSYIVLLRIKRVGISFFFFLSLNLFISSLCCSELFRRTVKFFW